MLAKVGVFVFLLTIFLDLLDLSFGRILWFMKTLRFWLYFLLHFGISCLAALLIHNQVKDWYLLAPVATLLGVGVISNTNIKIAGLSLVPVADLFLDIKAKMAQQAAGDKANELVKAQLIDNLRALPVAQLEEMASTAMTAKNIRPEKIQKKVERARNTAKGDEKYVKIAFIHLLIKANQSYAEQEISTLVIEETSGPDEQDDEQREQPQDSSRHHQDRNN